MSGNILDRSVEFAGEDEVAPVQVNRIRFPARDLVDAANDSAMTSSRDRRLRMKAIVQHRYGPPEAVLEFREIDQPAIQDDEVVGMGIMIAFIPADG
jgi:hypothetical protein